MKRIYLSFLFVFSSIICYASSSSEANMKIKLILLRPLVINSTNMDFGTIVAGTNNNKAFGDVFIKGQGYNRIRFNLDSATRTENGINLIGPSGSKPIEVILNSIGEYKTRNSIYELENSSPVLPYDGNLKLKILGIINVPIEQKSGIYKGTLTFKIRYD